MVQRLPSILKLLMIPVAEFVFSEYLLLMGINNSSEILYNKNKRANIFQIYLDCKTIFNFLV